MGSLPCDLTFTFKDSVIEKVKEFYYLGVIFTKTCNFDITKKSLSGKVTKATYKVFKEGMKYTQI